jgi:cytochrome c peroxidase
MQTKSSSNRRFVGLCLLLAVSGFLFTVLRASPTAAEGSDSTDLTFADATGRVSTYIPSGSLDTQNPFFQDLGTNGRRCVTCHMPDEAWTITPDSVQARFDATGGTDPIFRNNDGSNCEGALFNTLDEERAKYSLLLTKGLIRVGLNVPQGAEFVIDSVTDPNGCTGATNDLSAYRRPLPATNLPFLSAVMWDGRESSSTTTILADLAHQANDATRGHAQAFRDLTATEQQEIVAFETGLFTAQAYDNTAGTLQAKSATGGPEALSKQTFFIGINDPVGLNPSQAAFDPNVFTIFNAWNALSTQDPRNAVARGQAIFNTKSFTISGVAGLNNQTFSSGVTVPGSFSGTCTICHDSPNVGDHSVKAPLDIGLTNPSVAPYLPVYRLRNVNGTSPNFGHTVDTTDPGRAMITGHWADVNKFKGPILRALAARAPYFHNGSATTLSDVVEFYNNRFSIGLTSQEKSDLVAFLRSL